jgi:hypothetical protein
VLQWYAEWKTNLRQKSIICGSSRLEKSYRDRFTGFQWRKQKFSKEGASAAYFSNFTAWLMAIMLCTAVRNMQQKV